MSLPRVEVFRAFLLAFTRSSRAGSSGRAPGTPSGAPTPFRAAITHSRPERDSSMSHLRLSSALVLALGVSACCTLFPNTFLCPNPNPCGGSCDAGPSSDAGAPPPPLALSTAAPLPACVVGQPWHAKIEASGGAPPYTFRLTSQPPELAWLSVEAATGVLAGTPTSTQGGAVGVAVADSASHEASRPYDVACAGCGAHSPCAAGLLCCGSGGAAACFDGASDPAHCGSCERACSAGPHARARCSAGTCIDECDDAWGACGDNRGECATDLTASPQHCGACGVACPTPPANGRALCVQRACQIVCDPGYSPQGTACVPGP
jgi:hypothetical protein